MNYLRAAPPAAGPLTQWGAVAGREGEPVEPFGEDDTPCSTKAACPGLSGTIFGANMEPSWLQVGAKSGPSWVQVGAKTAPRGALGEAQASRIDFDRFGEPTLGQVGAKLGPSWLHNRIQTGMFFRSSFWIQFCSLLGSIWDSFGGTK